MPELPEVETTLRGLKPHVVGKVLRGVKVYDVRLRWPIPASVSELSGKVLSLSRRAKYLLWHFRDGALISHLGMSGSLRVCAEDEQRRKHDHVDLFFEGHVVRYHDPRRFGAMLWAEGDASEHALLANLGPEPLGADFHAGYLFDKSRKRNRSIKAFLMDQNVVVGVGNIYACESLFLAGVRPSRKASRLTKKESQLLYAAIVERLSKAIECGGTTLRDFVGSDGTPGYFAQSLHVYGREGEPCDVCGSEIKRTQITGRSTFYCSTCQR